MIRIVSGGAFRIVIYPLDHDPPHVHVVGGGQEVKVKLGLDGKPPSLLGNSGMKMGDVRKAVDLVELHQALLWDAWRRIHG